MLDVLRWLSEHYVEIVGTLLSIIYVFLSIKQNIWLWPFGIISSLFYIYIFLDSKIYADMALQVYYVAVSIYGWYFWLNGKSQTQSNNEKLKVRKTTYNLQILLALSTSILFIVISQILIYFTDSEIPYWDAFTTSTSIVATWMLAKKYIEHWFFWIIIDIISSGLYFYKELYVTVFLYLIYTIMAVVGYLEWNKSFKNIKVEHYTK